MDYRFTLEARQDLYEAAEFYDLQREGLGTELAVEVGLGIARILEAPTRWSQVQPGVHKYRIHRFPYAIFYRVSHPRLVDIVAVLDLRREPGSGRHGLP